MNISRKIWGVVVLVAAVLAFSAVAYADNGLPFSDIAGHWAEDEIASQAERGVVKGHEDGTFGPDEYVTRAQMVTFLDREQELEEAAAEEPVEARRGCAACHQGKYSLKNEAVEKGGSLHESLSEDAGLSDCLACHAPGTGAKEGQGKMAPLSLRDIVHPVHMGSKIFTGHYMGNCFTCHNVDGEGTFQVLGEALAADDKGIPDTDEEPGEEQELSYVGSETCQTCHPDKYADFAQSGHPFKLSKVVDGAMPTYPFSDITGALGMLGDEGEDARVDKRDGDAELSGNGTETDNQLGTPDSYSDVSYVIGGYGWKARFVDADGFVITGDSVQYNLETESMAGYHNGEANKPYNCGNCHTTGWKHYDEDLNANRQGGLSGMDGTFAEPGIQCESCHGPGSAHAVNPSSSNIVRNAEARTTADLLGDDMGAKQAVACSECHTRDGEKDYPEYVSAFNQAFPDSDITEGGRIIAKGGLGKHHEQYDELLGVDPATGDPQGEHLAAGLTCVSCHDPHKTVRYQDEAGESGVVDCTSCHGGLAMPEGNETMADVECTSCHMPLLAKSAVKHDPVGSGPATGDVASHIFEIDMSKDAQLTEDGKFVNPWLTKDYACLTCHNGVDESDLSEVDLSGFTFHE